MIKPVIFRQYDIRGIVNEELNEESYYLIGKGFGTYLRNKGLKSIVFGIVTGKQIGRAHV